MIEKYELNQKTLPTVPNIHDCVIKKVSIDDEFLTFTFEDDISYHDSIQYSNPHAKTLMIRYHLIQEFKTYKWKLRFLTKKEEYIIIANDELIKMAEYKLEYLYENIGYKSVILKLWHQGYVIVDIYADYIEYEWFES